MEALQAGDPSKIGPYQIIARIGSGGMGTVFLGERGTQQVAIKFMLSSTGNHDKESVFRFYEEAKTLYEIKSDFVAPIFEWQFSTEPFWFATEYIAGPNLEDEVTANGPLSSDALHYLIDCCNEGLAALHRLEIVHQDLKPANIVLSDGGPKIIDLGLARNQDTSKIFVDGEVMGTPAYISPEQILGNPVTVSSDYFSLGVSIYQAAVGRLPWKFQTKSQLIDAILNCSFVIPDDVDETVSKIIKGLLVANTDLRLSYEEIQNLICKDLTEPLHKKRRDLQRMDAPGQHSEVLSRAPVTLDDVLSERSKISDPSENPLLNPLLKKASAGSKISENSPYRNKLPEEDNYLKAITSALTKRRIFDRAVIPETPAKRFLREQLNNTDSNIFASVVISEGKGQYTSSNWYSNENLRDENDVYNFINWQFKLYGTNEPHIFYQLSPRNVDSVFMTTLMKAVEILENTEFSEAKPLALYWLGYMAIELANVANAEEIVAQCVTMNFVCNLSASVIPNSKQEEAHTWLNLLYNADGINPPDIEFASIAFSAEEMLPSIEMRIACCRLAAMNGLPNALGTLTWIHLTSGRTREGHEAFNEFSHRLGSSFPEWLTFPNTFEYEVANAKSNDAFCRLAMGHEVESALSVLDECIAQGATDGAFARPVMMLRNGKEGEAIEFVHPMPPELRETIQIWPELAKTTTGWFQEFSRDVVRLGNLTGIYLKHLA